MVVVVVDEPNIRANMFDNRDNETINVQVL